MSYYWALWFSRFCCCLPGRFCDAIGAFLGWATWMFVPAHRKKMAEENIMLCLKVDSSEAKRIAKASWVRFGPMLFEVLRFPVLKKHMDAYVQIEGREHLEKAMAQGQGVIIAAAHSGNWELMGGALATTGFPIVGVAMKQKEAGMDRFINEYRRLVGMHVTYKTDVREMFKLLGKGWFIGLIMDQDTNRHDGIILDFFGRPTNCVPGPASIARSRRVPIFPAFITRLPDGRHRIIIHAPVVVEQTQDKHADILHATAKLNQIIEEHVRAYPEEWFWLHDRWKSLR